MRKTRAILATIGALLVLLLGGAGTASAHAALLHTDPEQNSVVATEPAAVTLTFSEGVTLDSDALRVLDPAGKAVDTGNPGHADGKDDTATIGLRPGLGNGTYTVAWRAVSADTHVVGGAFTFSIGAPSDTSVSASQVQGAKSDGLVAALYGTGRTVAYAAYALLVGVAAFVLLCWPGGAALRSVQRLLMTGWVALLAGTVGLLLVRGPYERGTGIGQAFDLTLVRASLDERLGTALAARLLLLAAAGVFLSLLVGHLGQLGSPTDQPEPEPTGDAEEDELRRLELRAATRPQREARLALGIGGLVLALALGATWAGADHAAVGIQVWLALPLDLLHLLAMACWLGGLVTLLVGLRHGLGVAAVDRFSKVAFAAVATLAATGVYQSWRGVGSWGALVSTEYGRLLLIKVGLVLVMLGTAWFSRRWVARLRATPEVSETVEEEFATAEVGHADDPVRQAQLTRQRAALATAKVRRAQDGSPLRAGLRRSVLVETAVAVGVLVVTTMLTNSPPGRVAGAVAATAPATSSTGTGTGQPVDLKIPYDTGGTENGAKGTATLTLDPAQTGGNAIKVVVDNTAGQPVDVPEVDLSFTLPDRDLGPLPVVLAKSGPGTWSGTAQLPLAGDWVAAVVVRSSDIDQTTATKPVKIG
ncbi:copper transport protein [Kitasatospora sp. MAP12-15]|uniref:copper resistance protein CopC n=1 Tax=unclassified Kitasatospora TaxID=2633591 RepID=UPI002473D045|nr:copper resistance protein CopC [Kitasatospora sp. MAP12-44]MDH6112083.1 copper transport protein [Kitasatospora sp. MAP12-44]